MFHYSLFQFYCIYVAISFAYRVAFSRVDNGERFTIFLKCYLLRPCECCSSAGLFLAFVMGKNRAPVFLFRLPFSLLQRRFSLGVVSYGVNFFCVWAAESPIRFCFMPRDVKLRIFSFLD
jgi:hypothetical protein